MSTPKFFVSTKHLFDYVDRASLACTVHETRQWGRLRLVTDDLDVDYEGFTPVEYCQFCCKFNRQAARTPHWCLPKCDAYEASRLAEVVKLRAPVAKKLPSFLCHECGKLTKVGDGDIVRHTSRNQQKVMCKPCAKLWTTYATTRQQIRQLKREIKK